MNNKQVIYPGAKRIVEEFIRDSRPPTDETLATLVSLRLQPLIDAASTALGEDCVHGQLRDVLETFTGEKY